MDRVSAEEDDDTIKKRINRGERFNQRFLHGLLATM